MAEVTQLVAFTAEHVARLTGLSHRQLRYWSDTGFFAPKLAEAGRGQPFGRIYSFRDVVGLRTIAILRNEHGVALQELRRVGKWLSIRHHTPWASLRFWIGGRSVFFEDPQSGKPLSSKPLGQGVLPVDLQTIAHDLSAAANRLREREPDQIGQTERNRYVLHNARVIAGTRVPTSAIWNLHQADLSVDDIIREYPRLRRKDVMTAIRLERGRKKERAV